MDRVGTSEKNKGGGSLVDPDGEVEEEYQEM